jgi:D-alanyl-lipoteichoic acid acyltransferase DltB (MBOAT superfamily)
MMPHGWWQTAGLMGEAPRARRRLAQEHQMQASETIRPAAVGAWPAASDKARISLPHFALVAVQLLLVLVLIRQFQIEGKSFVELTAYAFAGFAVHAFLPLPWRLPFFALLSLGSIVFVLGVVNAAWIIAIGAVLIGICHLNVSVRLRVVLLLAAGAVLMAQRAALLPIPWSEAIWPILGSMFMFRLIVYFYDLRHDKMPVTVAQSAGYFAMMPNVTFPLFPVVDFKNYRRGHYAIDAYTCYQKGIDWIVRGVVHLILYRVFYYHVTLAPSEVVVPADLLQYLVANFMLYLRVSGLFHLVVGLLHLFGFHLPETHNRYMLASSFTDFWRRINIYWKDFMQKIFYFPAVFALKRLGTNRAVIVSTMYVFVLTWFLHSYQWFWLRGTWLFVWQDILFWAVLGVLVVFNSLYEIKYGRNRTLSTQGFAGRQMLVTVAKTYATFWFICVLWSFWTSESIGDWLLLWAALKGGYTLEVLLFPLIAMAVIVLGSIPREKSETAKNAQAARRVLRRDRAVTIAIALTLVVLSIEEIHTQLGSRVATTVHSLRSGHLSRLDNAKLDRGYYEGLLDVGRFNSQLWEVYSKKPANWLAADFAGIKRFTGDFAQTELIPSIVSGSQYGPITTNRHGLRDKEYADARPPELWRVAVLGPSNVMGWGVADGATFEALLEERLNREPIGNGFRKFELLNFGVPGYQPPQQLPNLDRALRLQSNVLMYVATGREPGRSAMYLAEVVRKKIPIPYPGLQAIVDKAGVTPGMGETEALKRLEPLGTEILQVVYREIAERARRSGQRLVWVFLPQVRDGSWQEETPAALRAAQEAGFIIINLDDIYKGHEVDKVRLAQWDEHPNAFAHRLIAERLYQELAARAATVFTP